MVESLTLGQGQKSTRLVTEGLGQGTPAGTTVAQYLVSGTQCPLSILKFLAVMGQRPHGSFYWYNVRLLVGPLHWLVYHAVQIYSADVEVYVYGFVFRKDKEH